LKSRIVFDLVLANHIGNFPNADGSMPDHANKVSRLTRVTLRSERRWRRRRISGRSTISMSIS